MLRKVEISYRTIIFTVAFVAFIWLLFAIRSIILALFIALILMSALNPSVRRLEQFRLPRWLAILLIYFAILAFLAFGVGGLVPPLIDQTSSLINQLPDLFKQFQFLGVDEKMIAAQLAQFSTIPANLIKFIFSFFSNLVAVLALGVITFYLLMERQNLDRYLKLLFGEDNELKIETVVDKIEARLGGWVRGELVLMIFVGVLSYIGFRIIGLHYALPLAILAFLLEIIPNVGPILATFPAVLIGLTISPFHAVAAAALGFLVQQVENTILVPRVMKQVAGVNPLITIISLAVGFKLAGVGGAILAVPTFIVLEVVASEVSRSKRFNRV